MSNMSYCRFENTLDDLRECREALEDVFDGEENTLASSVTEHRAAVNLISECGRIIQSVSYAIGCKSSDVVDWDDSTKKAVGNLLRRIDKDVDNR